LDNKVVKELVTEITVMSSLHHPCLLPLLACCLPEGGDVALITPYKEKGSLSNHIRVLSRKKMLKIVKGIAFGMAFLHHQAKIVHCDLSTQ